jgi:hypothetical protein
LEELIDKATASAIELRNLYYRLVFDNLPNLKKPEMTKLLKE